MYDRREHGGQKSDQKSGQKEEEEEEEKTIDTIFDRGINWEVINTKPKRNQ